VANTIRIYKSTHAEKIDRYLSGNPDDLRVIYEAALRKHEEYESQSLATRSLADMVTERARAGGVPWTDESASNFAEWRMRGELRHETDDEVLRNGYLEAVRLALSHNPPVPLETFWVTGAGDDFEVHISDGEQHVTVFMIVPGAVGSEHVPAGSFRASAKSWVVTAGARAADDGRPDPHEVAPGVVKLELSGR
jgi:hypothetical protein